MINKCMDIVLSMLPAPACVLCGAGAGRGLALCTDCHGDLHPNHHPCPHCAAPLPSAAASVCGECAGLAGGADRVLAPYLYDQALGRLINRFKFHSGFDCGGVLARLLEAHIAARPDPLPQLLIPVPLHPGRLRERGFNQALELARPLARRLAIPLDPQRIERLRPTPPQSRLDAPGRRANLRGAFRMRGALTASHVALIDDVITTGSTLRELTRLLRRAGVERVECWAVARTPRR
ncbi:MAG: ComF family protein [gamma proteobacterium symbiont of Phacoides pectinatus]